MMKKFTFEVSVEANIDTMWVPYLEGALRSALKEFTGTCAQAGFSPSLISAINHAEVRLVDSTVTA